MTWRKKLTHLSFPRWHHLIRSGDSYQRWLARVPHLIFLSFLSLEQVLLPTWPISGVFLIRAGGKAKLPICRECHLKKSIKRIWRVLSSIKPKSLSFFYCFLQKQQFWESVIWEWLQPWCYLRESCSLDTCTIQHWSPRGSSAWQPAAGPLTSGACCSTSGLSLCALQ